jgi:hypothetical protein
VECAEEFNNARGGRDERGFRASAIRLQGESLDDMLCVSVRMYSSMTIYDDGVWV